MVVHGAEGFQLALGVPWRLEALEDLLSLCIFSRLQSVDESQFRPKLFASGLMLQVLRRIQHLDAGVEGTRERTVAHGQMRVQPPTWVAQPAVRPVHVRDQAWFGPVLT